MAISEKVREILTNKNRINILSTANKEGKTNTAVFGSARLTEDSMLSFVIKEDSRSLAYLRENPYASCLILLPQKGGEGFKIQGCRLYLKCDLIQLSRNPVYLEERSEGDDITWEKSFNVDLEKKTEERTTPDTYVVRFIITEARPIVDLGQGI